MTWNKMNVASLKTKVLRITPLNQYAAVSVMGISYICVGTSAPWSSVTLPRFTANDSYIQLTDFEASWLVTCPIIGLLTAVFIVMCLSNFLGRKTLILAGSSLTVVCWVTLALAQTKIPLFFGRGALGIGVATVTMSGSMYTAEIAEDRIRGTLGTIFQTSLNLGGLFILCAGPYMNTQMIAVVCSVLGAIFCALFIWMPESPYFLMLLNKPEQAEISLVKLRGASETSVVAEELQKVAATIEDNRKNSGSFKEIFTSRGNVKPFAICSILMVVQGLCGMMAMSSYMTTIFLESGGSLDANISSMILSAVQVFFSVPTSLMADRAGRRPLLMTSCAVCAVGMFAEGAFFYLKNNTFVDVTSLGWLPLTALTVFYVGYALGLGSVPWAVISELLPLRIKGPGTSLIYGIFCISEFSCVKMFQDMHALEPYAAFLSFSVVCTIGFLFVLIFLPETKKKSFQQIDNEISKSSKVSIEVA